MAGVFLKDSLKVNIEVSKFMKKGAITVFMLLIITSVFTLGGVMIDLSRIILADYAVSSMCETATRSMMANYDADLVGDYGLFAIEDTKEIRKDFLKYLKRNMNADENNNAVGNTFSVLKFKNASLVEDEISIEFSKPISEESVFKKQVKEYHAPRAVLIGVDRIVSQVSNLLKSKAVEKVTNGATKANDVQEKLVSQADSTNTKLQMLKRVTSNPEKLVELKWNKAYEALEKNIKKTAASKGISEMFNVGNREVFKKKEFSDIAGLDTAIEEATRELNLMLETVQQTDRELESIKADSSVETYNEYSENDSDSYVDKGTSSSEIIERVQQIKNNITNAQKSIDEKKSKFNEYAEDEVVMQVILSAYEFYDQKLLKYEDLVMITNENKVKISNSEILECVSNMQRCLEESEENKPTEEAKTALEVGRTNCYIGMNRQIADIGAIDVGTIMEIKKTEAKEENPDSSGQKANANNIYSNISALKNMLLRDNSKYQIYKEENDNPIIDNIVRWISNQLGIGAFEEISNTVKSFKEDNLVEQIIYASYILDKTNYITSSTKRQHYFNFAETEYILHNYSLEGMNAIQSVFDVLRWRFAIDTAYYMIFRSPPAVEGISFLVKLGYAVTRGAIQAVEDIFNMLVMGKNISLVPVTNATTRFFGGSIMEVSYSDHLMVAMIFEVKKIPRMINTINATIASKAELENKSRSLTNLYTQVTTKVKVECDLVFMDIFGFRNILGNVNNGKYPITKETKFGY